MKNKDSKKKRQGISEMLEEEITLIVNDIIKKQHQNVNNEDVEKIINGILPELDKLISKRVKYHFRLLTEYVLEKIKEE